MTDPIIDQARHRRAINILMFWFALAAMALAWPDAKIAWIPMGAIALASAVLALVESRRIRQLCRRLTFAEMKSYMSGLVQRDVQ